MAMQAIWEAVISPGVLLALIPLGMALAVVAAEVFGWVEPPSSRGSSGCWCGHSGGL
jgi:predicted carbohydrate-binding protein with CBM5 and CBM33 domain